MKKNDYNINSSGYNPKIQISSGLYSITFYQDKTAVRTVLSKYNQNKILFNDDFF